MNIFAPISKVEPQEDGSLKVYGIATSEMLDKDREIIDYGSAKKAFGEWPGNIREQHDSKKAVGRALSVSPLDDQKAIALEAFISKGAPDTQAKVLDGTLRAFSIGGSSEKKLPEVVKGEDGSETTAMRVFLKRISEVSLVDSPCNPACSFQLVKADDEADVAKINDPKIVRSGSKFKVVDSDGKVYGTFANKNKAKKQLAALYAAKDKEKTDMPDNPEVQPEVPAVEKHDGCELLDVTSAINALGIIESLINVESSEEHNEPPEQIAALQVARQALKDFIASEVQEDESDEDGAVEEADKPEEVKGDPGHEGHQPEPAAASAPPGGAGADGPKCQKCGSAMKCDKCSKTMELADSPPADPAPEPPAPEQKADEPADEAGLFVSKLGALERRLSEFETVKADFDTYRKEAEADKASLQAQVEKLSKTVVEPGRPVMKGDDRIPVAAPAANPSALLGLSVQDILKLAPDADEKQIALRLAEAQTALLIKR